MTKIEWVRAVAKAIGGVPATWNPIRAVNKATGGVGHYCVHKSAGCARCYAERWQPRFKNPIRFAAQDLDKVEIVLDERALAAPARWRKRRAVFPCDMTDLAGDWVSEGMLRRVWGAMAAARHCVWMVLTKRPDRLRAFLKAHGDPVLPHVWLGVSVEDQATANERIPQLMAMPAAVRFISAEPLLAPVDLNAAMVTWALAEATRLVGAGRGEERRRYLHWVIVGGESGPGARPFDLVWARALIGQCRAATVPVFVKQMGAFAVQSSFPASEFTFKDRKGADPAEWPADMRVRQLPSGVAR